jgi:hypothetical protein
MAPEEPPFPIENDVPEEPDVPSSDTPPDEMFSELTSPDWPASACHVSPACPALDAIPSPSPYESAEKAAPQALRKIDITNAKLNILIRNLQDEIEGRKPHLR